MSVQKHARTLEMSAEVDIAAAIQKLRGLYEELKREDNRGHMPFGEATYNVGLLLAEMLIYQVPPFSHLIFPRYILCELVVQEEDFVLYKILFPPKEKNFTFLSLS